MYNKYKGELKMSYIYKIGNTQFELTQVNKNLWIARNPKLRIWYTASTYDKLCARIEEQYEQFPENFVEMTEQQMLDLDDEDYETFCKWRAERAKM